MGEAQATGRTYTPPKHCPRCGADDLDGCRDHTACIVNQVAPLTAEDIEWAINEISRLETG